MTLQQRRAVLAIAAPLIFGLASLTFGRNTNWDLRNYHWYNPYAWLTDRYQIDIAPAGGAEVEIATPRAAPDAARRHLCRRWPRPSDACRG